MSFTRWRRLYNPRVEVLHCRPTSASLPPRRSLSLSATAELPRPSLKPLGVCSRQRRAVDEIRVPADQFYSKISRSEAMATFELYRRSSIGMCLTETLDEMVSTGTLSPELAYQVLVQFDKSMTEALETQVKSKVSVKGHLHTYRFCDNVWTFILQDAVFKSEDRLEQVKRVKIVACDSKLLTQ
ncbi:hypothetical protein OPV22_009341 [Ensete ventricosum]|nr:hypothetical protein OPV22_009341 [Ensete ventricosum]